ncbi:hypothetical protein [Parabacteroides sp. PF5-9]|uniref:hypothetical protein n=1 Tax=Parabacteroides sp. PF5-9 TaxID=1742404 RepID=UPI0024769C05|nr:hypothetical protein [Parabacteroides sp. PF5-9]MDH6356970.1 hypothetical protein [Parabacteroides sp. PF5-9]
MTTVEEFGYNPVLKEITEQLKEQKEWIMEYLGDYAKTHPATTMAGVMNEIEGSYDAIALHIAEIVSFEFKENVFYNENKK